MKGEKINYISKAIEYIGLASRNENTDAYLKMFDPEDQYRIVVAAKKLLVYTLAEQCEPMVNACYKCKHRGSVPGDTHSCCKNPLAIAVENDHGIKHGWFFHPFNFDPVWLLYCDGLDERKE